jgi:hypothetical protein
MQTIPTSWPFSVKVGGEDQRAVPFITKPESKQQANGKSGNRPPNSSKPDLSDVPDAPY